MTSVSRILFRCTLLSFLIIFFVLSEYKLLCSSYSTNDHLLPSIVVALLIRNKEYTLPYFFGYLERLDYPTDRISLWIRSDHNIDDSVSLIETWLKDHKDMYHSVNFEYENQPEMFSDASSVFEWSPLRFNHLIKLKEAALKTARQMWADYILYGKIL